jgi:hypothetical protein
MADLHDRFQARPGSAATTALTARTIAFARPFEPFKVRLM